MQKGGRGDFSTLACGTVLRRRFDSHDLPVGCFGARAEIPTGGFFKPGPSTGIHWVGRRCSSSVRAPFSIRDLQSSIRAFFGPTQPAFVPMSAPALPSLESLRAERDALKERIALQEEIAALETRLLMGKSDLHQIAAVVADEGCKEFGLSVAALTSEARPECIAWPRQVVLYLIRELSGEPYAAIGKLFDKDHSTVMHGCDRVRGRMQTEPAMAQRLAGLHQRVSARLKQKQEEAA